jgi:hypothetical protein
LEIHKDTMRADIPLGTSYRTTAFVVARSLASLRAMLDVLSIAL